MYWKNFFLAVLLGSLLMMALGAVAPYTDQQALLSYLLAKPDVPVYGYKVMKVYPHDSHAFTEGLLLDEGYLYESTGLYQQSTLRRIDLSTGKLLKEYLLPAYYFAEGIAVIQRRLYQLTYQSHIGFVYDKQTFKLEQTFQYAGEGWGLTTDGNALIMSDGSAILRFIDPHTFREIRTVMVHDKNQPVHFINALQYIHGKIYANVWHSEVIVIISPNTGSVTGWINLHGLNPDSKKLTEESVLNGIAYHPQDQTILVTGKDWPFIYAIKLLRVRG